MTKDHNAKSAAGSVLQSVPRHRNGTHRASPVAVPPEFARLQEESKLIHCKQVCVRCGFGVLRLYLLSKRHVRVVDLLVDRLHDGLGEAELHC